MISTTSEYALMATVYLTQHADECPLPARRIAEDLHVPRKYLSSVLRDLVRAGVLKAAPGKRGGFQLQREPKSVRLQEVLAPFEPKGMDRPSCPFGNLECSEENPCAGHDRWKVIKDAYRCFVNDTSIYDVSISDSARPNYGKGQQSKQ